MKIILSFLSLFVASVALAQDVKTQQDSIASAKKAEELKEVTVFGNKKQFLKVESDKTIVSVKDNGMLNSGNSLEAIKRLPGVITSPTGGLTLNGKGVTVYIDGSPSTLNGTDLQNYLSSLPANAIEKVELIYNPGAAYDANASGSIINIITSSKRLKGVNANFNINYNFNKYQKPSPQILLNGKEKNFSWQTMLGYNYIDSENRSKNSQTFTSFAPDKNLFQENFTVNTNRNLYFRLGTNYKLSSKSNLLFNYNGNFANDRSVFNSSAFGENIDYNDEGFSKNKNYNNELSLQYKTKLDTLGRTLDVTAFLNTFDKTPINQSSGLNSGNIPSYNNGIIDFNLTNYYLKYDFAIPFNKLDFTINTGGKYNSIKVNNFGQYNINSSTNTIFDSNNYAESIDFNYNESNLAFYVEARKKIKKFNFTVGLRLEDFDVKREASTIADKIEYRNTNLFPNISALYEISPQVNFSSSYSRKIAQPNYNTIDPNNSSNFNQYNTTTGNLGLQPVFYDNFEVKLTALQFVQLGANYTIAKDDNRFIFSAKPGELVSNQTFQQFDKIKTFSAFASFPIPLDYFFKGKAEFQKRMNTIDKMNYIYLNINYVKSTIDGYSFPFDNKAIVNYGAQAQIILPWQITNTLSYFILPKGTWEIYQIEKPIQQFDISFNKDFMNKKLKVGLHCFDVFNKNEVNALIVGENLDTRFYQKQDSRTFRVSLTYNFGNLKLEQENINIDTEKVKQGGGIIK
ncbi:TonB-dependent receptor-like protein [Flavobacterium sp. 9R]|uniref:TonB-dependent receptor domain-containing protein n=1 Tax=Flavobacterium sp. 9R TaxID=2653143 RepID=UPI0012F00531|nr:TonB-dependent receptor [Flavobacterium sp. 9R]VXB47479.1 TonB-dependent receptor-like protein [Flavobacterium sp. 9R]